MIENRDYAIVDFRNEKPFVEGKLIMRDDHRGSFVEIIRDEGNYFVGRSYTCELVIGQIRTVRIDQTPKFWNKSLSFWMPYVPEGTWTKRQREEYCKEKEGRGKSTVGKVRDKKSIERN